MLKGDVAAIVACVSLVSKRFVGVEEVAIGYTLCAAINAYRSIEAIFIVSIQTQCQVAVEFMNVSGVQMMSLAKTEIFVY